MLGSGFNLQEILQARPFTIESLNVFGFCTGSACFIDYTELLQVASGLLENQASTSQLGVRERAHFTIPNPK